MIQKALGFSIEQRVHTGVATINLKETTMTTTNTIPATQNEAFMWSAALCRVAGHRARQQVMPAGA